MTKKCWFGAILLVSTWFSGLGAQVHPVAPLKIDEEGIRLTLLPKTHFDIPFVNTSDQPIQGMLLLEMLDPNGKIAASISSALVAKPGTTQEKVYWPADKLPTNSPSLLGWYRLRYTLRAAEEHGLPPVRGIVQLGRLMTDAFEVRLTGASQAAFGAKYPVRIRVDNPGTGTPCAGIPLEVQLEVEDDDDDDRVITRKVVTDGAGYAVAEFDLPGKLSVSRGEVTATATRGSFSETQWIKFEFLKQPSLTVTTDKPLYQPGQTVHMRLLGFGFDKKAWEGASIKLTIENEDWEEEFHSEVRTSSFGVATADWEIPEKFRLGRYTIAAEIETQNDGTISSSSAIRVSRYDLPTFTVKASPDRSYYLPGQDAQIEISAEYLFGKPVQRARVKVLREENRRWNFQNQKWEVEQSAGAEGELDSRGKFIAHLSLVKDFENFEESKYRRFQDLALAAYVTDLSTGRTEQRRFKLRLSLQPIHLYFTSESPVSSAEPLRLYVTSSYADGTPASVSGTIEGGRPNEAGEFDEMPDQEHRVLIGRFHTNRFGVARVELPALAENLLITPGVYDANRYYYQEYFQEQYETGRNTDERTARLLLHASDTKARTGRYSDDIALEAGMDYMRVHTDRSLYRPGDVIGVSILSNTTAHDVILSASTEKGLLWSQVVRLNRGRAELTIPYVPKFRGQINIVAYAMTAVKDRDRALAGMARVIYPSPEELRLDVHLARTTYRPGETVSTAVKVKSPDGRAAESALGVLVFDRAVAERLRSDEEFGNDYGFSVFNYFYPDYSHSIAGITYRDLLNLDEAKPITPDLDLAAELILRADFGFWMGEVAISGGAADYGRSAAEHFKVDADPLIEKVKCVLDNTDSGHGDYPKTEAEFRTLLKTSGINTDDVRDPWDLPYRPVFSVAGAHDTLALVSSGVDKRPNTNDDFAAKRFRWRYFAKVGEAMNSAMYRYQEQTGRYIRDYATLRDELKKQKIDLDGLRDPWGGAYRYTFSVSSANYEIKVDSAGPDKRFDNKALRSWDDVHEWTSAIHYFRQETEDLNRALAEHFAETAKFPKNEEELRPLLKTAGLTPERLLDPWGRPYHFTFTTSSRYWDRVETRVYSEYPNQPRKETEITPVTQKLEYIQVVSYGPENKPELAFPVAEFSRVMAEQSSRDIRAMATPKEPPRGGGTGGISGTVTDQVGAVVPGVLIVATSDAGQHYRAQTNSVGLYAFSNLPSGMYRLEFIARGFRTSVVIRVPVLRAGTTKVDTSLMVGAATETVEVQAEGVQALETTTASIGAKRERPETPSGQPLKQLFTPRLRQYFPETLFWKPELTTDKRGNANFKFSMGDNITAWKMSIMASTRSGEVGVAEKELRSFQPFFIEHDPPKVLTEGDRINLPVVLRNYLGKPQIVEAELRPEKWFSLLSAPRQSVTIAPNGDASTIFGFRADTSIKKGLQRVSARNAETGDAIERQIKVHPDGQEISLTVARVLSSGDDTLELEIPGNAIPGSTEGELRIYPNLIAQVIDALDALSKRPGGCIEQITSLGYANLLLWQALKKTGQDNSNPGNPRAAVFVKASQAVQNAVALFIAVQKSDGGFSYWYRLEPDVALTAYVLRYLNEAAELTGSGREAVGKARAYLLAKQAANGAWRIRQEEKYVDDPTLTAYATRALAMTRAGTSAGQQEQLNKALALAMEYIEEQIGSWNGAYLVGNYAIAAVAIGQNERIARAQRELARLAHNEGAATYWNLEANTTPFYGWGSAGLVETTALAVEALARLRARDPALADSQQIGRGLQYLLRHTDRYAMWYSSQATQNVIEAMIAALPTGPEHSGPVSAKLLVNGRETATLKIPPVETVTGPITIELREYFKPGGVNQVRVVRPDDASVMNASLLTSYYLPRSQAPATADQNLSSGDKRALRLKVQFDRTEASVEQPVRCHVEAERIGFRGYGMMLAEIGLPPGADVDRDSLEKAKDSGYLNGYEVQPDRVVFYLWPSAGGSSFDFQFRLRFRMEAMSAPSLLYDYYNPEANAAVSPVRFLVR